MNVELKKKIKRKKDGVRVRDKRMSLVDGVTKKKGTEKREKSRLQNEIYQIKYICLQN